MISSGNTAYNDTRRINGSRRKKSLITFPKSKNNIYKGLEIKEMCTLRSMEKFNYIEPGREVGRDDKIMKLERLAETK